MLKLVDATELAGHRLWQLRRARRGAALSRRRVLQALDAATVITQSHGPGERPHRDQRMDGGARLSYCAWEMVKILNIARKVRGDHRVQAALDIVAERSPELEGFRNAVTHPEDNRTADDLLFGGAAMRLRRPGMQPEYVIDPRYGLHDPVEDLVAAAEVALLAAAGPVPPGLERHDNRGRGLVWPHQRPRQQPRPHERARVRHVVSVQ